MEKQDLFFCDLMLFQVMQHSEESLACVGGIQRNPVLQEEMPDAGKNLLVIAAISALSVTIFQLDVGKGI